MRYDSDEVIDENYGYEKEVKKYPYILIKNYIDDIEILLRDLPDGDIPVCLYYNSQEVKTQKSLPRSIKCLAILGNIQGFILKLAPGKEYPVTNAHELINIKEFDWKGV